MSSSEGFVGPLLRDGSPRTSKISHATLCTRTQPAISSCSHPPGNPPTAGGDGDLHRAGRSRPGRARRRAGARRNSRSSPATVRVGCRGRADRHHSARRVSSGRHSPIRPERPSRSSSRRPAAGQGDLYLNPQVNSDLAPAGESLPLGGSTGPLIDLTDGTALTLTIDYQGQVHARHRDRHRHGTHFGHAAHAGRRHSRQRGEHIRRHQRRSGRHRLAVTSRASFIWW